MFPFTLSFYFLIYSWKREIKHQFSCASFFTGGFFVTGINLTEDLKYICSHPTESLKDMVMSTYPTLLSWVKQQKPGSNTGSLNIIAGDFVTESRFIPTVIALNENLLKRTIIPEPWASFSCIMYLTFEERSISCSGGGFLILVNFALFVMVLTHLVYAASAPFISVGIMVHCKDVEEKDKGFVKPMRHHATKSTYHTHKMDHLHFPILQMLRKSGF